MKTKELIRIVLICVVLMTVVLHSAQSGSRRRSRCSNAGGEKVSKLPSCCKTKLGVNTLTTLNERCDCDRKVCCKNEDCKWHKGGVFKTCKRKFGTIPIGGDAIYVGAIERILDELKW